MLSEMLRYFHFLLKQTTALIKIFQVKLSFIALEFYDIHIKMLDLEQYFIKLYFAVKNKEIRE